jgi:hypothetical protein
MACAICEIRRPKRFCPGVRGDICSICCGTEREVTVDCPLDCEYLQDARKHEKAGAAVNPDEFPNRDIRVTEDFLRTHEGLVTAVAQAVASAGLSVPGAVDFDVREALDALVRTYRTLQSGVYYETRPSPGIPNQIFSLVQDGIAEIRRTEQERSGLARTRDAEILGTLAFLQRLELDRNNGRKRGRAFLDFLRGFFPDSAPLTPTAGSSLIVP